MNCHNADKNCRWMGTLGTIEEHLALCEFTLIPCPRLCRDASDLRQVKRIMNRDLDEHLANECPNRDFECVRCGKKGTYVSIVQEHDKICDRKMIPCPNSECANLVVRLNLKRHLESCDYSEVHCKYQRVGCDRVTKRKEMLLHEQDDKLHLCLALNTAAQLQGKEAEEKIVKLDNKIHTQFTFKMARFKKMRDSSEIFISPSFYSSTRGYHVTIRVDANGCGLEKATHISIFALIGKGKYDAELKWPFEGTFNFMLLNQLEDANHFVYSTCVNGENGVCAGHRGWGSKSFIPYSELCRNSVKNTQYLKDDTLYFRVSVEVNNRKPWLECSTS